MWPESLQREGVANVDVSNEIETRRARNFGKFLLTVLETDSRMSVSAEVDATIGGLIP